MQCFFFFQAEDGIRDATVTGVQTCALPISQARPRCAGSELPRVEQRSRPGARRESGADDGASDTWYGHRVSDLPEPAPARLGPQGAEQAAAAWRRSDEDTDPEPGGARVDDRERARLAFGLVDEAQSARDGAAKVVAAQGLPAPPAPVTDHHVASRHMSPEPGDVTPSGACRRLAGDGRRLDALETCSHAEAQRAGVPAHRLVVRRGRERDPASAAVARQADPVTHERPPDAAPPEARMDPQRLEPGVRRVEP